MLLQDGGAEGHCRDRRGGAERVVRQADLARVAVAQGGARGEVRGDEPPPLLAVHAGGRSVLDAVEHALDVDPDALADSRAVLARFGNMSSATILFVLADMMARGAEGEGIAIAFGPGLAAEAIRFTAP